MLTKTRQLMRVGHRPTIAGCRRLLVFAFLATTGLTSATVRAENTDLFSLIDRFGMRTDLAGLERALKNGSNVNARNDKKETPLHVAVQAVQPEVVSILLKYGADPNAKDYQGVPPLMEVGVFQNPPEDQKLDVARRLVEKGADVNATEMYGKDVLSYLVGYNLPKVTEYLISKGAKVNRQDERGRTALHFAAEEGRTNVAKILLKAGADPDLKGPKGGWSALDCAIHYKRADMVDAMMASSKRGPSGASLITAATEGQNDTVKKLVGLGADINAVDGAGMTALHAAIINGRFDTAKILLAAGANPNTVDKPGYGSFRGETPLCTASRMKSADLVAALLTAKADVDAPCGAVVEAARAGSPEVVKLLINAGADVRDRFTGHWRALFIAAEKGDVETARALLARGTPVDMRDDMDSTALMIAASQGNLDVIRLLVQRGANLEAVNAKRPVTDTGSNFVGTPLGWAMVFQQPKAVDLLRSLGAKPQDLRRSPSLRKYPSYRD